MLVNVAQVVFAIPDIEYEPDPTVLAVILEELDLLRRDGAHYDAAAAAQSIREAQQSTDELTKIAPAAWSGDERVALVRALDHLRNAGRLDDEGCRLHDRHRDTSTFPLRYEVRGLATEIKPSRFVSHSGEYNAGDRIVVGDGSAWIVLQVEPGLVRPRLVLDDV